MNYTEPVVKGEKYTKMLPKGFSLVLEGGGTRGFYSAGVFEAFMDNSIMFPYIIGVSAGAANALTYIAGQKERNRVLIEKYVGDKRYLSKRNLLKHKSLFGFDFIFGEVPKKHLFWDEETFKNTDIRFLTGAANCKTGKTIWFEKQTLKDEFTAVRASCSIPIMSKIVEFMGYELLDGGITDPIPIEKSIEDGNDFHVIVLTRNQGYRKNKFSHKWLIKLIYKKYPQLIRAIMNRHEVYNRQLKLCESLEKEGKALIIRPILPLEVDSTGKNIKKLLELYDEGHREGKLIMDKLQILCPFLN